MEVHFTLRKIGPAKTRAAKVFPPALYVHTWQLIITIWNSQSGAYQISGYNVCATRQAFVISDAALNTEIM